MDQLRIHHHTSTVQYCTRTIRVLEYGVGSSAHAAGTRELGWRTPTSTSRWMEGGWLESTVDLQRARLSYGIYRTRIVRVHTIRDPSTGSYSYVRYGT